ncbi:hypothetical protein N7492_003762 [Penicillium capsulatum]|uniref:Protein kinase domain-containing protein n=1 Tax=Penicillium capsulatum TaxID=69766 RepID=A0A9W9IMN9_9EURO|nr:hypothetical protein N7492_003762 [Penicillium capsulatum]KAJ6121656.1 hypothetical protein N7512_004121 [Penicillium capsulatum]
MHPPDQAIHHHFLKRAQESPGSLFSATRSWTKTFWSNADSESTDRQPLLRSETDSTRPSSLFPELHLPFTTKYGRCLEILHYGGNSTIRLHERKQELFAVKVYRRPLLSRSVSPSHSRCSPLRLVDSHPRHPNILPVIDLLHNERSELCLVLPYCTGGDLHELLCRAGPLPTCEADCLVTQILRALAFLHKNNIAHQDIRLETVLLTERGAVKLAGFGNGHIRRLWAESAVPAESEDTQCSQHIRSQPPSSWLSCFLCLFSCPSSLLPGWRGSLRVSGCSASFPGINLPYIPPEGFHHQPYPSCRGHDDASHSIADYDPRPVDIWAVAMIYLALLTGRLLWRSARPGHEDSRYLDYLHDRCNYGYPQIELLGEKRRNAIYAMLDPNPQRRITAVRLLQSEWISAVSVCEAGKKGY